ncbi:DUF6580 family putative transport protein [Mucilaginibacter myungsuensis]|uniref:Uncharacterized protein n=1 Tax=Mucilaginibacter myungsuensis TaxID=649104 RepID=A0A929PZH2_9SPHI|nr:DUF6580 family putative transport protein [Mucilaginibacter myungsuensis]MBE9664417.1 hypothetical protein [Mucilaginibacter myungsuensis]MDN3597128.1 hypothetical protein [Mucilaginibacter myungsuensis]
MSTQKINTRTIVLIAMIVALIPFRLVTFKYPELSNFTPFGAIALFGGAYFTDKWKAFLVVFAGLFVSDIVVNYLYTNKWVIFHSVSVAVYLPFLLMVAVGMFIKKVNFVTVGTASLVSVLIHWLIANHPIFYGTYYTHDMAGYMKSLTLAIPFERNMLLADLIYGSVLFGGFEFAKSRYTVLRTRGELAI